MNYQRGMSEQGKVLAVTPTFGNDEGVAIGYGTYVQEREPSTSPELNAFECIW